jgi:long-chain acyl-CoA synthetase
MNLGKLLDESIGKFGEYQNVYDGCKWYTNVEVLKMSNRLCNALRALGVQRGDRVATQLLNCVEVFVTFSAVYRIGATVVPMVPMLRPDQISYIYKDNGAKVTVTTSMFLPWIQEAQKTAPELKHIILVDKEDVAGTLYFPKLLSEHSDEMEPLDMDNDDVAAILYTSGTTGGNPKGVMLTHFALWISAMCMQENAMRRQSTTIRDSIREFNTAAWKQKEFNREVTGLDRCQTNLAVLPLSHSYGLNIMNFGNLIGARFVIMKMWNPLEVLKTIQEFRIGFLTLVPTMYVQLMDHPDFGNYDLSSIRSCACGAAPMDPGMGPKWREKTGCHIQEGWGMTECGGTGTGNAPPREPKYGSVGINVLTCNQIKVFDKDDHELPVGQEGELVIKGPVIMKGYWNLPEETAKTIVNGWLHTGDLGYKDEDGYFYVSGRKKDLIIRGGENVSPMEVEDVVCKFSKVAEAGCVGIKDRVYGEEIKVFVVLKKGEQCTEAEIIEYCKQQLPKFKTPKQVQFMEALPKNMLGKILRAELRKLEK